MITRWKNVKGEFVTDIFTKNGKVYDSNMHSELPPSKHEEVELPIPAELLPKDDEYYDLVIEFRSSGYYDSGWFCGPPENCYPPEDMEEREIERVYCIQYIEIGQELSFANKKFDKVIIELNKEVSDLVFDHFNEEVYEVPLDDENY